MSHWIRQLFTPPSPVRKFIRRSVRLRLESLEDRFLLTTTWVVTNPADSGANTLRADVAAAQTGDKIEFGRQPNGQLITNINLNTPIGLGATGATNVTIGDTHTNVTISGQNATQLFESVAGNWDLDGLTLTGGWAKAGDGGAIVVDQGATLWLAQDIITNNQSSQGAGGAIANLGTLNINNYNLIENNSATTNGGAIENTGILNIGLQLNGANPIFTGNSAINNGGAIDSSGTGQLNISNSSFTSNSALAGNGGAIQTTTATTLNNDQFTSNKTTVSASGNGGNGGAIYSNSGTGQLTDAGSTYGGNIALGGNGGAIDTSNNTTLTDDTFSDKNAAKINNGQGGNGGALAVESAGVADVYGCTFDSNTSDVAGGAIENVGQLTVQNSSDYSSLFTNNNAGDRGGAIDSSGNGLGNLSVTSGQFYNNSANSGGAIGTTDATTLTGDTFGDAMRPNTATFDAGGAINALAAPYFFQAEVQVNSCSFVNNQSPNGSSGAIYTEASMDVEQSTFTNNSCLTDGGAISSYVVAAGVTNSTLKLNQDTFTGNNSGRDGGAVASTANDVNGGKLQTIVTADTFYNNKALFNGEGKGGGLYIYQAANGGGTGSFATLTNDTFFQNTADGWGGGIFLLLSDNTGSQQYVKATLTSLTVYQNTGGIDSGGLYAAAVVGNNLFGVVFVHNCILDGNFVTAQGYKGPIDVTMPDDRVLIDQGYNLVGTTDTMFGLPGSTGDLLNNTTGLANTLAQNGAPATYPLTLALTAKLDASSPGYQKGDPTLAGQTDERGFVRRIANFYKVSIGAEDPDALPPS